MNVMITGAAGFIGGFLTQRCLDAGCSVLGIDIREPEKPWTSGNFEDCDVRDARRLSELVGNFRPDTIYHLAAQSYPTVSLIQPRETIETNVSGTVNLFECVRELPTSPVVVVACSSAEYGPVDASDLPTRESHPLRPLHPYGVSKVAQDLLAAQYFANYSIPAVRIRIFNTTGPGKIGDVCSDLTRRATEIELGIQPPKLKVGNLTRHRAIIDVRDMVEALWLSARKCEAGEVYNVGGRQTYSVEEIIDLIRGMAKRDFIVEQEAALVRGCDEAVIAGDISKFQRSTGWNPSLSLSTTLCDMLDWWRNRRRAGTLSFDESQPLHT